MKISVVIASYCSQKTILPLLHRLSESIKQITNEYEIIIVDDASPQITKKELLTQLDNFKNLKIIFLARRCGQHNATLCGILHSSGEIICTVDDDLQYNPEDLLLLINEALPIYRPDKNIIVYGIADQKKPLIRFIVKKTFQFISRLTGEDYYYASSFRCFSSNYKKLLQNYTGHSLFLDAIFHWNAHEIRYVKVNKNPPLYPSRYKIQDWFSFFIAILGYSFAPIRIITYSGILIFLFSIAFITYLVLKKLFFKAKIGYTSTMIGIIGGTGLIMMSIGIIGEYLYRLLIESFKKPSFIIDEITSSNNNKERTYS